jgi:molybdopterin-guanine dinucleotide biosynthesis protein B
VKGRAPIVKIFGLAGWSGSGKTTLLVELIPWLRRQGLSVSTIKHAHHGFELDQPGKDSHRHREAGAREVLISSGRRWALVHELDAEPEPTLAELLGHLSPVDLVLVEGFKRDPSYPKLEVWRSANDKPLICPEDPSVVALASDRPVPGIALPRLSLDDIPAIGAFLMSHLGLPQS